MNERNQNQQPQQDQEPAQTTRKAGCKAQGEDAELELARSLGFGCVAAMKAPNFMAQLSEHSRLFEQAYRREQAGLPADYAAAFAVLGQPQG